MNICYCIYGLRSIPIYSLIFSSFSFFSLIYYILTFFLNFRWFFYCFISIYFIQKPCLNSTRPSLLLPLLRCSFSHVSCGVEVSSTYEIIGRDIYAVSNMQYESLLLNTWLTLRRWATYALFAIINNKVYL